MKTNKWNILLSISVALLFTACGSDSPSTPGTKEEKSAFGFVFTSDFTNGELRFFDLDSNTISKEKLTFNQDAKIVVQGSQVFILERYGADNLVKIDPSKWNEGPSAILYQTALGEGANPSDIIALNENTAWLGLEGSPELLKINTASKGKVLKTVDLSAYTAEGNISPNLVKLALKGDTLFALLQRLDMYQVTSPGLVVLIDANAGTILDTIRLKTGNPSTFTLVNGDLWVSTQGGYNADYGLDADSERGIERVDIKNKKSVLEVSGEELGGGVSFMVVDIEAKVLYASVMSPIGTYSLQQVSLDDNSVKAVDGIDDSSGSLFWDAESALLFIGDRSYGAERLLVYNGTSVKTIKGDNVLPPSNISIVYF